MKFHFLTRERERGEGAGGTVPRSSKTSVMKEEMNEHHYPPTTYFTGIFTTVQLCGAVVLPILYRDDTRYYSILDIILHSIRLFYASWASPA